MKIRSFIVLLSILSLLRASAAFSPSLLEDWYSLSFASYADGEELTDKGATNGTWGASAVPVGGSAVVGASASGKYLAVDMSAATSNILFTATQPNSRGVPKMSVDFSFSSSSDVVTSEPPDLAADAKAALTIIQPTGGAPAFYGFTGEGWVELHLASGALTAQFDTWYGAHVYFRQGRVSYVLDTPAGEEPLVSATGVGEFASADADWVVRGFEVMGKGALGDVTARDQRATVRVRTH